MPTGQHSVRVNDSGSNSDTVDFYIDDQSPTEDSVEPSDNSYTSETSPNIQANINKNGEASLQKIWLKASGNGNSYANKCTDFGDSNPRSCSFSPSLTAGNTYDISWNATDSVGNQNSGSWTFTVDTSYDGDSSASFEYDSGYIYSMQDEGDDFSFDVSLGDSSSENADIRLKCYAGSVDSDNLLTETSLSSVGSDGQSFSCEIPGDEYSDQSVDIVVEACDEAGNCQQIGETTYSMDLNPPSVVNLESSSGVSTFNSGFDVSFEASDSATSVEQMEYFFDDATIDEGEGTQISGFDDGTATIDPSSLESGSHTLYVRAKDEAGKWSSPRSFEFEYYPDKSPKVSLQLPSNVTLTAGESGSFDVTVDNTGEFLVESAEVSVSSEVFSSSKSVSSLEPEESSTVTFKPSAKESDIGSYSLDVSVDSPSTSGSVNFRVKANQQQQSDIQQKLDKYSQKLDSLEQNVTELKQKVNDQKAQQLESNISEFRSDVQEAREAVESGEYYRAKSALDGINSDFSTAQNSYQNVQQSYRSSQRMMYLLIGLAVVLVSGVGSVGYLAHEGRIDVEEYREKLEDLELGSESSDDSGYSSGSSGSGESLVDRLKEIFSSEPEAEEFEWDGFKD